MSISKLLMTSAVCAMSMAAVSTSYGSAASLAGTEDSAIETAMSPSQQRFISHDGTGTAVDLKRDLSVCTAEDDTRSQMSSMSVVEGERLEKFLKTLWNIFKRSGLPLPHLPAGTTKLSRIEIYAGTIVDSHNGLRDVALHVKEDLDAVFTTLVLTKDEKAAFEAGKISRKALILKKNEEKVKALTEAETALAAAKTALIAAERSKSTWKNTTIATGGVLVVVIGVLANIIRNHCWAIIVGGK